MHLQPTFIIDEAKLLESVKENVHVRASCTDHFRERLLSYTREQSFGPTFLPNVCELQKYSRQALFRGIKELINQVRLFAVVATDHVLDKHVGEPLLIVERATQLVAILRTQRVAAVAVAIRKGCSAAMHPSPKKSPPPIGAIVATLPCAESTLRRTVPA